MTKEEIVVLDPGTLLSLSTAGAIGIVARGCGVRFIIANTSDCNNPSLLIDSETNELHAETLAGSQEIGLLLRYAADATEDEAAAAALAESKGLPLVSDEPKLRRIFSARVGRADALLTLPELLWRWEARLPGENAALIATVSALRTKAHYCLSRSLPGADWWQTRSGQSVSAAR